MNTHPAPEHLGQPWVSVPNFVSDRYAIDHHGLLREPVFPELLDDNRTELVNL